MFETPLTALVLGGGGARAAYQVGVLRAVAQLRRERLGPRARLQSPFGIIVGTSAGAINAAALACSADNFDRSVEELSKVWLNFRAEQVYRADSLGVIRSGAQWLTMLSLGWAIRRWQRAKPRSLLDNAPLAALLKRTVPLERLPLMLAEKQLHAFAVTASRYSNGEHLTFFTSAGKTAPWSRSQRRAVPATITREHLLASSAIPFIFPAARIAHEGQHAWFGDGSMRQTAPLSPAVHLGAERLLIIGNGRMNDAAPEAPGGREDYPSLAQIAGHAMASIFLDALAVDIERMQRINRTLALLPDHVRQDTPLRPLESLVIAPSRRIDEIASRHVGSLPGPVRTLLRGVGVRGEDAGAESPRGAALASYLLFESPFTRELIALGEADTMARRDEVLQFFAWGRPSPPPPAPLDLVLP